MQQSWKQWRKRTNWKTIKTEVVYMNKTINLDSVLIAMEHGWLVNWTICKFITGDVKIADCHTIGKIVLINRLTLSILAS